MSNCHWFKHSSHLIFRYFGEQTTSARLAAVPLGRGALKETVSAVWDTEKSLHRITGIFALKKQSWSRFFKGKRCSFRRTNYRPNGKGMKQSVRAFSISMDSLLAKIATSSPLSASGSAEQSTYYASSSICSIFFRTPVWWSSFFFRISSFVLVFRKHIVFCFCFPSLLSTLVPRTCFFTRQSHQHKGIVYVVGIFCMGTGSTQLRGVV